ncbi:hypothetical protein AB0H73_29450 [Streptomyces olivoreticuli]|uniref:hypothetical protein n=1 Tax=Streptomyces olivoreticuli TaxID=68246 RepID=UPI001F080EF5|nr:hypothetical protein [Streptomyces olivoreticuli]
MSITIKSAVRAMSAVAVIAAFGLTAPQASAADHSAPRAGLSAKADSKTRAFAAANPKAVAAAGNACGEGYELQRAIPLPKGVDPKMRLATLFNYTKGGNKGGCSIYDNNTGKSQTMSVKVCASMRGACQEDKGNFTQYAGPVRTDEPVCATVTAYMQASNGVHFADYNSEYAYLCD